MSEVAPSRSAESKVQVPGADAVLARDVDGDASQPERLPGRIELCCDVGRVMMGDASAGVAASTTGMGQVGAAALSSSS